MITQLRRFFFLPVGSCCGISWVETRQFFPGHLDSCLFGAFCFLLQGCSSHLWFPFHCSFSLSSFLVAVIVSASLPSSSSTSLLSDLVCILCLHCHCLSFFFAQCPISVLSCLYTRQRKMRDTAKQGSTDGSKTWKKSNITWIQRKINKAPTPQFSTTTIINQL